MTPVQLLQEVKGRFAVLLHDESDKLDTLLKQAVTKYQDLAGFMTKARITADNVSNGEATLPERFQTRVIVKDAKGRYVRSEVWGNKIELTLSGSEEYPLSLMYLESVRDADFSTFELPAASVSMIADYLELLISSPNAERLRRIAIAGKLDASDIPTEESLATRRAELEERMKNSRAILPPVSLF